MATLKKSTKKAAVKKAPGAKPPQPKPQLVRSEKPLPAPVPVPELEGSERDPYNLAGVFQSQTDLPSSSLPVSGPSSAHSSISEPRPGEPLSAEAEEMLSGIDSPADGGEPIDAAAPMPMAALSHNPFKQEYVAEVLEELFTAASKYFESDHWLLSDRQSRMLAEPSTELLGSLWGHLQRLLPTILERWAQDTPGLMDAVFAFSIVLAPKVTQQFVISRQRKLDGRPKAPRPGPQPVRRPGAGGPVGPISTQAESLPFEEG